jgi:hypothetical protein
MIEALILWGVLSGNRDRWDQYMRENSDDETPRDFFLTFFFFTTIFVWPLVLAIHIMRLAVALNFKIGMLFALVPLGVGLFLGLNNYYLAYFLIGINVAMLEMVRVGIRAINV